MSMQSDAKTLPESESEPQGWSEGPLDAKLVIVGEAWGQDEEWHQRPFVGRSGQLLNKWLYSLGLHRRQVYVTNVVCRRPPNNKIDAVPKEELAEWAERLHARLAHCSEPVVIVAAGATALAALLRQKSASITNMRGNILSYTANDGREIPMVPLLHPAAILRSPDLQTRTDIDLTRVRGLLDGTTKPPAKIETRIIESPDAPEFINSVHELASNWLIAIDIETAPKARRITSIAFAGNRAEGSAIVWPLEFWRDAGHDPHKRLGMSMVRDALTQDHQALIFQNGFYDLTWLSEIGGLDLTCNYVWDTRWMHHAIDPSDEHGLAYLASIYTAHPYWKSMRKSLNPNDLYVYNGMDAAITYEIFEHLHRQLVERGRLQFYHQHYRQLYMPLFDLQRHGVRVDDRKRAEMQRHFMAIAKEKATEIDKLAGEPLVAKTAVSHTRLCKYLYEKQKLPVRMKDKKPTTNETALISLRTTYCKNKPEAGAVIDAVLEHRRATKLHTTFLKPSIVDRDKRARCEYTFTPVSGRLSSSANPLGTGLNLQNIDAEIKHIFLPDEGRVMLEVDLSQAEWRIMAMLTRDPKLIQMAQTPPTEFDVHRFNASLIFGCSEAEVTKDMRQLGKRSAHAADYGMQAKKLSEILLADGYVKTVKECEAIIAAYMNNMPPIRAWQAETAEQVRIHRCLANGWGRMIYFNGERITDDTYREAYAWRPQSECADLLNHYGLLPLDSYLLGSPMKMNLQIHDALYISVLPQYAFEVAMFLSTELSAPRYYYGQPLRMPCTFKLGHNCKDGVEFKALPSRETFTEVAREVLTRC